MPEQQPSSENAPNYETVEDFDPAQFVSVLHWVIQQDMELVRRKLSEYARTNLLIQRPEVAPKVYHLLVNHPSPAVRLVAAYGIDELWDVNPEAARPLWVQLLQDPDQAVQQTTMEYFEEKQDLPAEEIYRLLGQLTIEEEGKAQQAQATKPDA